MDYFIGEIRPFTFSYAPRDWMMCQGQLLSVQQFTPLFSIIGTQFGGNGTTTFQLPNIAGSILNGSGQAVAGSFYTVGETGGASSIDLLSTEMPVHNHTLNGATSGGLGNNVTTPTSSNYISNAGAKATNLVPGKAYAPLTPGPNGAKLNVQTVGINGGSQPHENRMPFVAINYCICVRNGEFPARS
jgi:microcystin-dependent protein